MEPADTLKDAKLTAIQSFEQLAGIPDDKEPSFVAEIAKALLITTLGNVGGGFLSRFLSKVVSGDAAATVGGIANDSMQSVTSRAADGAMASTSKTSALMKSRVFFSEGLKLDAIEATRLFKDTMTHAIHANTVLAKDLDVSEEKMARMLRPIVDSYRHEIMLMWPRYAAQASLGTHANQSTVTNMDDYFGEQPNRTNEFSGKPDRGGTSGVLSIRFTITDSDPYSSTEPVLEQDGWGVNDMNAHITEALKTAGQLDAIELPKEIFVRLKGSSNLGWARMAIDESGQIRDVAEWNRMSIGQPKFYSDPASLWQRIRGRKLVP